MSALIGLIGYLVLLAIWKAHDTAKDQKINQKLKEDYANTNLERERDLLDKYQITRKFEDGTRIPRDFKPIEFDHLVDQQLRKEGYRLSPRWYDMSTKKFDSNGRLITDKPKYKFDADWYFNLGNKYK